MDIPINEIKTPAYVVDERLLIKNLEKLKMVMDATDCKILLAQKGFSMFYFYPLIAKYLSGTTASGLYEARLGFQEMGKETHVYSPAFHPEEMDELVTLCDHVVFNSFPQYHRFKEKIQTAPRKIQCGIRVNPEYAEVETELYNPCAKNSRLGVPLSVFEKNDWSQLDGIHFHTMCEQNSDVLERTLEVFEQKFGKYLSHFRWINFGGGHHITREDYDIERLIRCINYFKEQYDVQVYLEPGEAVALNTGYLVAKVLDVIEGETPIAILDTSAACHMPDVLEMPYRPHVIGSDYPGQKKYTYRLGGPTCLAGDIIGDYAFDQPLKEADRLVFCDMAHYTMVKNNTFNGVPLPSIYTYTAEDQLHLVKEFSYLDFKNRLS